MYAKSKIKHVHKNSYFDGIIVVKKRAFGPTRRWSNAVMNDVFCS